MSSSEYLLAGQISELERLRLQALEKRLLSLVGPADLEQLRNDAEAELKEPGHWGTTFTLIQSWGRLPG